MPKWKKDAKEFVVGVNFVENRGYSSSIPKPVIEKFGNPDMIKFVVNDDNNHSTRFWHVKRQTVGQGETKRWLIRYSMLREKMMRYSTWVFVPH